VLEERKENERGNERVGLAPMELFCDQNVVVVLLELEEQLEKKGQEMEMVDTTQCS
jgi:hypothetical protein